MIRRRLLIAVAAAVWAGPAWGQGFNLTKDASSGPVEVFAEQGIEWSQNSFRFIARGNAKATRGNVTVSADTLIAHYRKQDSGSTDIYRLEAEGNVTIATPNETATGVYADYNVDTATMLLKGSPARLVTPTDTITATSGIEYNETGKIAVARGDATAIRADKRIRADVLTTRFKEGPGGNLVLKDANAVGKVIITTQREVATGDKGDYDAATGIATLTGSVKITREENQLNGGYAHVNLNTGISRIFAAPPGVGGGRVQGLFVPENKQPEVAPAPAPAPKGGRR